MNHDIYRNIVFIKFKRHFPEKTEDEINAFFDIKSKEEIFCGYCNCKLNYPSSYPLYDTPSLDHKTPRSRGGKNEFENIIICCLRCNIVKGTMFHDTYIKMLELLSMDSNWMERILSEIYPGRATTKMIKDIHKKEAKRYLHEFS